ncbi:GDSL-type esterase/lipase family protein [Dactylosporangium sp. NPDC051484]|uniref:GDSL-type esterase/lipase family protein n=1 Tax=Dactylosporangium sp. NPDC051484 TaxID=3154942 RepID=UPI00344B9714
MAPRYYALGDSMSIDDYAGGPGLGAASLLADDLGIELMLLARDGATSDDVLRRQLGQVGDRPALITVTMGGNDLLSAMFESPDKAPAAVEAVAANYDATLTSLAATGARIVVSTVYDPTDGTGDMSRAGLPDVEGGVALLEAINTEIRTAAARHGAAVADLHAAFLGHGAQAGDITLPDSHPANRELWLCGHIEPNAWGAEAIRDGWRAALRR